MIAVWIEEMHGSDRVPDLNRDCERALVGSAMLQLERNGAPHRVHGLVRSKSLDAADIVRDAMLRQPSCQARLPVLIQMIDAQQFPPIQQEVDILLANGGQARRDIRRRFPGAPMLGKSRKATVCYCSLSILFAEFTLQCQDAAQSAIIPNTRTLLSRETVSSVTAGSRSAQSAFAGHYRQSATGRSGV